MRGMIALLALVLVVGGACSDDDEAAPPTTPPPPPIEGGDTPLVDLDEGAFDMGSPAFDDGTSIPVEHTCEGEGDSPPLAWGGVPPEAVTLELVVEDPDTPAGTFLHWRVTGIDADSDGVAAGEVPPGGTEQENQLGEADWQPPCPPEGSDPHRYIFRLTAHDAAGDEVGRAELVGRFGR